ncbi:RDD family protein [Segniliparus rugosus]|uniref:RDD domain-containing protein n=1 Tax=Segniliparus rugosus (strain ATCC BAA-974 / DSM 45345 / CCUG 50838 / CIP 108380 / JCM 13579 / CDC 945) TaxID=679197 RepID=E5XQK3_SEGRC|nr:RDD family protein [Segniliparus rugosus]EFV13377.1 hypothetical protein HMPREF9336_01766 [Segniliparus rugosus ATCC BAA-974]
MYAEEGSEFAGDGRPADTRESQRKGYATWGSRVLASVIDSLLLLPFQVLIGVVGEHESSSSPYSGTPDGAAVASMLLVLGALGVCVWNVIVKQGRTGQTVGKEALKIRLVQESTGRPIGPGVVFVRQLAHILDVVSCYVGYLWPLWDAKRQTFADKVMRTVVVKA